MCKFPLKKKKRGIIDVCPRINLIDKNRLQGEAYSYSGTGLIWKARLFLFLGFALIAGGLAGSCVSYLTIPLVFILIIDLVRADCKIYCSNGL